MSTPADYLRQRKALLEQLQLKKDIGEANDRELAQLERLEAAVERLTAKQKQKLKEQKGSVDYAKKLNVETYKQVGELSSISGVYSSLVNSQQQSLKLAGQDLESRIKQYRATESQAEIMRDSFSDVSKLTSLQQQLAETGPEQVDLQDSIRAQYEAQKQEILDNVKEQKALGNITDGQARALEAIVSAQDKNLDIAGQYATISAEQKELIQSQIDAYDGIKKTLRGVVGTAKQLFSGWKGFVSTGLFAAGAAVDKLGKNIRSFGGYIDSAQISTTALGLVFDDAEDVAKGLSRQMGGLKDITFTTQLNTNLMAMNMGISGEEAANVVGSFARLNNMSADTAMDMAATTKEMAKAAGVPVDQVMKDVAGSAEKFAEYGKDGGLNIAKAAVSAAKLGVGMDSLTKVTDSLLDFETSINQELELGAMLGKNLSLDRARALAYEGNIGGAVKETLQQLGGIEEFNKMDIFQKRKAAELLGLSVDEFQKMAANSDKLNEDGSVQLSTFDTMKETLTGIVTGPLGGMLKGLGGGILAVGQMSSGFSAMGVDMKSIAQKIPLLNKLPGIKGGATDKVAGGIKDKVAGSITGGATEGAGPDMGKKGGLLDSMKSIDMGQVLKGAAALLVVSAAVFVFGKAVQEFMKVSWESVGMAVVSMLALVGAVALLGMIMSSGVGAVAILAGAAAMLVIAASVLVLGLAIQAIGKGFEMLGDGFKTLSPTLEGVVEQMSMLSQISFLPILGLAASLGFLAVALTAVAAAGLLAIPILAALGVISGGNILGGGGGGQEAENQKMDELINEIKALRTDLLSGKIGVNMDGQKVTSRISSVVSKVGSNSYAKV